MSLHTCANLSAAPLQRLSKSNCRVLSIGYCRARYPQPILGSQIQRWDLKFTSAKLCIVQSGPTCQLQVSSLTVWMPSATFYPPGGVFHWTNCSASDFPLWTTLQQFCSQKLAHQFLLLKSWICLARWWLFQALTLILWVTPFLPIELKFPSIFSLFN